MQKVPGTEGLIQFDKQGRVYIRDLVTVRVTPLEDELSIGSSTSQKIGMLGASPTKRGSLTTQLTAITHTAPGADDFAVQDFVDSVTGAWAWKSHDEANTVHKVIANLQTRLVEVETLLKAAGLLPNNSSIGGT